MDLSARERDPGGSRCPWCGAVARRRWFPFVVGYEYKGSGEGAAWWGIGREADDIAMSFCDACRQPVVWHGQSQIWPASSSAPPAARHMPAEVRASFDEARAIVDHSPRAAAALLRLSLRALAALLVPPGGTDDDVRTLVESVLPDTVRPAFRTARVLGDGAVRPGELDPRDDRPTALALFDLVNLVVEKTIAEPAAWRG